MSDQKCSCAEMDWTGHDLTQPHHPDCRAEMSGVDADASLRVYAPIGEALKSDVVDEWQVGPESVLHSACGKRISRDLYNRASTPNSEPTCPYCTNNYSEAARGRGESEPLGIAEEMIESYQAYLDENDRIRDLIKSAKTDLTGIDDKVEGSYSLSIGKYKQQPVNLKSDCQNERPRLPVPVLRVEGEPGSGPWRGSISVRVRIGDIVSPSSSLACPKNQGLVVDLRSVLGEFAYGDINQPIIVEMTKPGFGMIGPWWDCFECYSARAEVPSPEDEKAWLSRDVQKQEHIGIYGRQDHRDVGSVGPWFRITQAIEKGQEGGILFPPGEVRYVGTEQETCPFVHTIGKCTLALGHEEPHGGLDGSCWEPVSADAKPHPVITQDACWNVVSQAFMEEVYLRVRGAAAESEYVTVVLRNVQAKDFPRLVVDYGDLIHRVMLKVEKITDLHQHRELVTDRGIVIDNIAMEIMSTIRKVEDPKTMYSECDRLAERILDRKSMFGQVLDFKVARQTMAECFRRELEPGGIRDSYVSNIAMLLYDDQHGIAEHDLSNLSDCNAMAERLMKLIFED